MDDTTQETPISLAEALSTLKDPRSKRRREHELVPILLMVVAAMLSGARSLYAAAQWGRERREDDPEMLVGFGLKPGRSPSHPTLHRVFKRLDTTAFERIMGEWLPKTGLTPEPDSATTPPEDPKVDRPAKRGEGPELVAIDGKSLRGIHGEEIPEIHLVAAYAIGAQAVLGQVATVGKGHELAGVKAVLEEIPLENTVVMGDALQTQRETCETVVKKKETISSS